MALEPGARLGPYEILEPLGAGGMGEVYRARDPRLEREVAIKVLPEDTTGDTERLRRLKQEARAASALNHPNIITIHDIGEHEGTFYIAMEYVEGQTLREVLDEGALRSERMVPLATQIAEALAKAHSAGIVHRDLKPENVMVTGDGFAKVLDFGLAKLQRPTAGAGSEMATMTRATRDGTIVGTAQYMSPEQAAGRPVDYRSDQFSFGLILYEMSTGKVAFKRDTVPQTQAAIIEDEPEPLPPERVPPHFPAIVERCLAKNPEDRYDSTRDLARDLKGVERALSGPQRETAGVSPRQPRARRRWPLALLVVGALAAILALAVGLNVGGLRDRLPGRPFAGPTIESLAVLPLENLSGDPEQEYFVDGMHEALTAELSKIGALKVISRTSAMRYKGLTKPLPQIARELGVDGLIEGSVAREGDQVRISVQLIHGPTDKYLWSDSYQRELRSVLALQSEVARAIAEQIEVTLTPEEVGSLATTELVDPAAYEEYLRGLYQYNKSSTRGWQAAVRSFQQSVEKDSSYAPAHAMLSFSYTLQGYYGSLTPPAVLYSRALAAAERALALDDSLAEAHASLAMVRVSFDWDWAAADLASQEALRLNPNSTMALYSRAFFLSWMGRHEEAIAVAKRNVELDPMAPHVNNYLAMFYLFARRYDEAIRQVNKVLALEPDYVHSHLVLCQSYALKGMYGEAEREEKKIKEISGGEVGWRDVWLLALAGRSTEARNVYEQIPNEYLARPDRGYFGAIVSYQLGKKDRAFALLEQAYRGRSSFMSVLKVDPRMDPLRDDPRFEDLLRRMNFPE